MIWIIYWHTLSIIALIISVFYNTASVNRLHRRVAALEAERDKSARNGS